MLPSLSAASGGRRFRDEWLIPIARDVHGIAPSFIESAREGSNRFLATALLRSQLLTPDALGASVQTKYGCRFVQLNPADVERAVLSLIPERICREHLVLPLRLESGQVHVAMASPLDVDAEQAIRVVTGRRAVVWYCTPERLEDVITRVLEPETVIFDLLRRVEGTQPVELIAERPDTDLENDTVHAPVVRLVNAVIAKAVELRASDIHIEHEERASQVRYRVDGVLRTGLILPRYIAAGPVASRLKIMGGLDVAERRRPQDGQARVRVGAAVIALRISTLPTQYGEKVVARVLDARHARVPLKDLGFRPEIADRFQRLLAAEQGFILVTGPTGSGKTTTLYAAVSSRADGACNIVSIEDPIEYEIGGINQVQVNERQGLTFASVLRSVLRQDPDLILVGEIRDKETAEVACQAAMTGHLVLSTLHTNDASSAVARLADMGIDRYKIASSLSAVTAQRLGRRLCDCRRAADPDMLPDGIRRALRHFGLPERAFAPVGCAACGFTGYRGRVLFAEFLTVTPGLHDEITSAADADRIRARASALGLLEPLGKDVLWHLTEGHVSIADAAAYVERLDDIANDPAAAPPETTAPASSDDRPSFRVLIADMDVARRERLSALFREAGCQVDAVAEGGSAVARIAVQAPDAMITALRLPMLSGIDLIRYVRGTFGLASLPILVLDGEGDEALRGAALKEGAEILADGDLDRLAVPLLRAAWARADDFSPASHVMTARVPADEDQRLAALHRTRLLDTDREERFDAITRLATRTFDAPIALVTLVDGQRQWFKSKQGFTIPETPRDQAFCAHSILEDDVMVVHDAALDARFSENPLVTGDPHIRFYAGCPVAGPDGQPLGTLCVIDRAPRSFTEADRQALRDLGTLVEREIAASGPLAKTP